MDLWQRPVLGQPDRLSSWPDALSTLFENCAVQLRPTSLPGLHNCRLQVYITTRYGTYMLIWIPGQAMLQAITCYTNALICWHGLGLISKKMVCNSQLHSHALSVPKDCISD